MKISSRLSTFLVLIMLLSLVFSISIKANIIDSIPDFPSADSFDDINECNYYIEQVTLYIEELEIEIQEASDRASEQQNISDMLGSGTLLYNSLWERVSELRGKQEELQEIYGSYRARWDFLSSGTDEVYSVPEIECDIYIDTNRVTKGNLALVSGSVTSNNDVIDRIYIKTSGAREVYDYSPYSSYHDLYANIHTDQWPAGDYTVYVYVKTSSMETGQEVASFPLEIVEFPGNVNSWIGMFVNGMPIELDQPPVIKNDRTLVPVRFIGEALGADVLWNSEEKRITIIGNNVVDLFVGSTLAYIDEAMTYLDVPAEIMGGRTMVPVRFIAEAFGAEVIWNEESRTIEISTN